MRTMDLVSKNNTVSGGNINIKIDHCSDYVLTTAPIAVTPVAPTTPPKTGVADYAVIVFTVIAAALLFVGKKKLLF